MAETPDSRGPKLESYDPWFIQGRYRAGIGLLGAVTTVVFAFRENWELAVAVFLVVAAFEGLSGMLWWHRKQVRSKVEVERAAFADREASLLSEMQHERGAHLAAVEALHLFIHCCRDSAAKLKQRFVAICEHTTDRQQLFEEMRDSAKRFFQEVLARMIDVFRPIVPPHEDGPVQLWAAIREIQNIDGRNCFVTFVRQGALNPDRINTSEPVPENEGLPRALRQTYDKGEGILIVPNERTNDVWKVTRNDEREEDLSVMAGPIILKMVAPWQMVMILYLNSPTRDAFTDDLKAYMRCCTDTLSTVLNALTGMLHVRESGATPQGT